MNIVDYIVGAVLILFSIIMIAVVILQEGNSKDIGVVTGGADTFLSKNKARTVNSKLARWTKVLSIGFALLVVALNVVDKFMH
ncbi:preprotein translocase subunit SecG [Oscillospiraceae bacterium LCP25S3_E10]|nr:preprotein translocase subunit SecG [Ruminococcus sp.]MDD6446575.1 preprotein translocase subunit SecG [Ruminococcus sp.]MDY2857252.1 preprotein translocase subunit SecG [Oscillospiraceae bacterium]